MSLFSTVPCWSHALGERVDARAVAVFNLMRAKTNSAQIVVGSLEGRLTVLRTESSESETLTNTVFSSETESPILGLESGFFTGPSPLIDEAASKTENLELAVIHPRSIGIYTPKRLQDGDIGLELVSTIHFNRCIISACVITLPSPSAETGTALYHSKLAVRTDDGVLHICTRRVIATHRLGLMYSFPTPMAFCPGANSLVIATFDYTIVSFPCADIMSDTGGGTWNDVTENDATRSASVFNDEGNPLLRGMPPPNKDVSSSLLKPQWTYVIGERIQQLSCGRCFGIDSGLEGEVIVLHAHGITLVNASTGLLSVENQLPEGLLFSMALFRVPIKEKDSTSQSTRQRRISLPEISSLAVLDSNRTLHFFRRGELKWISKLSDSIDEPVGIHTPQCMGQLFVPRSPPKMCGQDGLFVVQSRSGSIQVHLLGTRPLDVDRRPNSLLSSLLSPVTVPRQAVTKTLMEEAQKRITALKVQHAGMHTASDEVIAVTCRVVRFYKDGSINYTIVELTLRDVSGRLPAATLGVIGCGSYEEPITDLSSFAEYPSFLSSDHKDIHVPLAGPPSSFIQLGDKDCFKPITSTLVQLSSGAPATVYVKLGISDLSFFVSPSLHVSIFANIKMPSEDCLLSVPFVVTRSLSLPLFSSALVRENSAFLKVNDLPLRISLQITPKEPFSTLHELLLKRPFSASILSEVGKKSPNSVCIIAGLHGQVAVSFQDMQFHIQATALEALPLGIEFLLGYKGFFQIKSIDYSEELILDKLLGIYSQCVEVSNALEKLNLRLGVTSELVADVLQLVAEAIPRVPFSIQPFDVDFTKLLPKYSQFSYQSVLGSVGFLTQVTFNQGQSILSATRCTNVGEKVDGLLSYYELQLCDAQQLSANRQHLLQKLRAGMNVVVGIIGICFLMRGESTEEDFEQLRQCLTDFEHVSHLYYFITYYSKRDDNLVSSPHTYDFTNCPTPDQFQLGVHSLLARFA
ncbi:Hypothetical protein GLP15_2050 [Giardia lamblia P15]|uniref:PTHB1 N-terminal domain-containing protein n=1 Tax=Giardia intestinalis (strain P15) TaxID=658858 RepID=E1F003_GIAIA|nr:Hypothetical protein GLP15_2050 [Giardia lamblia P15]